MNTIEYIYIYTQRFLDRCSYSPRKPKMPSASSRQETGHSIKKKGIMKKKKSSKFSSANTYNSTKKVCFSLDSGHTTKKVNSSLDSDDTINNESSEKPVSGGQST